MSVFGKIFVVVGLFVVGDVFAVDSGPLVGAGVEKNTPAVHVPEVLLADDVQVSYVRVARLPVVSQCDTVSFGVHQSFDSLKRDFSVLPDSAVVAGSLDPAIKNLKEILDQCLCELQAGGKNEFKKTVRIESYNSKNAKESVVVDCLFKKEPREPLFGGVLARSPRVVVTLEIKGLLFDEPVFYRNLFVSALKQDSFVAKYWRHAVGSVSAIAATVVGAFGVARFKSRGDLPAANPLGNVAPGADFSAAAPAAPQVDQVEPAGTGAPAEHVAPGADVSAAAPAAPAAPQAPAPEPQVEPQAPAPAGAAPVRGGAGAEPAGDVAPGVDPLGEQEEPAGTPAPAPAQQEEPAGTPAPAPAQQVEPAAAPAAQLVVGGAGAGPVRRDASGVNPQVEQEQVDQEELQPRLEVPGQETPAGAPAPAEPQAELRRGGADGPGEVADLPVARVPQPELVAGGAVGLDVGERSVSPEQAVLRPVTIEQIQEAISLILSQKEKSISWLEGLGKTIKSAFTAKPSPVILNLSEVVDPGFDRTKKLGSAKKIIIVNDQPQSIRSKTCLELEKICNCFFKTKEQKKINPSLYRADSLWVMSFKDKDVSFLIVDHCVDGTNLNSLVEGFIDDELKHPAIEGLFSAVGQSVDFKEYYNTLLKEESFDGVRELQRKVELTLEQGASLFRHFRVLSDLQQMDHLTSDDQRLLEQLKAEKHFFVRDENNDDQLLAVRLKLSRLLNGEYNINYIKSIIEKKKIRCAFIVNDQEQSIYDLREKLFKILGLGHEFYIDSNDPDSGRYLLVAGGLLGEIDRGDAFKRVYNSKSPFNCSFAIVTADLDKPEETAFMRALIRLRIYQEKLQSFSQIMDSGNCDSYLAALLSFSPQILDFLKKNESCMPLSCMPLIISSWFGWMLERYYAQDEVRFEGESSVAWQQETLDQGFRPFDPEKYALNRLGLSFESKRNHSYFDSLEYFIRRENLNRGSAFQLLQRLYANEQTVFVELPTGVDHTALNEVFSDAKIRESFNIIPLSRISCDKTLPGFIVISKSIPSCRPSQAQLIFFPPGLKFNLLDRSAGLVDDFLSLIKTKKPKFKVKHVNDHASATEWDLYWGTSFEYEQIGQDCYKELTKKAQVIILGTVGDEKLNLDFFRPKASEDFGVKTYGIPEDNKTKLLEFRFFESASWGRRNLVQRFGLYFCPISSKLTLESALLERFLEKPQELLNPLFSEIQAIEKDFIEKNVDKGLGDLVGRYVTKITKAMTLGWVLDPNDLTLSKSNFDVLCATPGVLKYLYDCRYKFVVWLPDGSGVNGARDKARAASESVCKQLSLGSQSLEYSREDAPLGWRQQFQNAAAAGALTARLFEDPALKPTPLMKQAQEVIFGSKDKEYQVAQAECEIESIGMLGDRIIFKHEQTKKEFKSVDRYATAVSRRIGDGAAASSTHGYLQKDAFAFMHEMLYPEGFLSCSASQLLQNGFGRASIRFYIDISTVPDISDNYTHVLYVNDPEYVYSNWGAIIAKREKLQTKFLVYCSLHHYGEEIRRDVLVSIKNKLKEFMKGERCIELEEDVVYRKRKSFGLWLVVYPKATDDDLGLIPFLYFTNSFFVHNLSKNPFTLSQPSKWREGHPFSEECTELTLFSERQKIIKNSGGIGYQLDSIIADPRKAYDVRYANTRSIIVFKDDECVLSLPS